MIKGFGISILHLTVGAVRVDSALRSGRAVELASENILACAVLVFSLVVMTPAALYAIRYIATHDASEILEQPARDIETGLDMIDQECQDGGELAGSNSTHAVAVTPPWLEPLHTRGLAGCMSANVASLWPVLFAGAKALMQHSLA